jgi:hypothetical protein
MRPENIKLAEELDFSGPVSFLLNRAGKRVVGCSTQAVWNLVTLLNEWPKGSDPMDCLMTIRAGINERLDESQSASTQDIIQFIKSEPVIAEQLVDAFYIEEMAAKEVIYLLKDHMVLLFTTGVETLPDQGHLGLLHVTNKRLYLDGTELDLETATKFLYSSRQNYGLLFQK